MTAVARHALFTSDFLARLERLALLSRRTFRSAVRGERRSLRRGHSVEFCDYRAYGVGDDLRYVDWNIYGRLDRLHVKLFVDEEDLCLHLLLDASSSMNFGTPTKLAYGMRLAAALGFVGLVTHELVGVGVLRDRAAEGWPPTRGRNQVVGLVDFLSAVEPAGGTSLNEALASYAMRAREPGLAIVISDLLDPNGFEGGVRALLERRFDVHILHVLAPEEMSPEVGGDLRLLDSETGEIRELTLDAEALRVYRERLSQFFERIETFARTKEIGYHRVVTETPVEEVILSQFRGRIVA